MRTLTSSLQIASQCSIHSTLESSSNTDSQSISDTDTLSHWFMTSNVPVFPAETHVAAAFEDVDDIIGHELEEMDAVITKPRQEIDELKIRQVLTDHVLNSLIYWSHGKPIVTCLAMKSS